jgi:hypothetical protein
MNFNHNPIVNPVPFNIQNPYFIKKFERDQQNLESNNNSNIFKNVAN